MSTNVLFIGDPHFQVSNITEINLFLPKIIKLAQEKQPDIIIIAGDLLHTHERLHTIALNKAYELVKSMRDISFTYILVGNHDYIQNQQFLTENHWMNALKEWNNVVIIDKVEILMLNNQKFIFVPYVPPGRFKEALDTLNESWDDSDCIFAHQEFYGCKMGAITSIEGDKWHLDSPLIVSGHIHSRQKPQENIYYSGSAMQNAFGESEKNIIAYITFLDKKYSIEEIDLKLPRKKIVYMDVEDIEKYEAKQTEDQIKLTLTGNYEQFKALKKTKEYRKILDIGTKIVFKPKKISQKKRVTEDGETKEVIDDVKTNSTGFKVILNSLIMEEKNRYLYQNYELIVNGNEMNLEDVFFL